jgi:hypothetical protein
MAMRLDVDFARPLSAAEKVRLSLAVAALAKSERVRFARGDRAVLVIGEALSAMRLAEVLAQEGFAVESIRSSLVEAEDLQADDLPGVGGKERLRPLGR